MEQLILRHNVSEVMPGVMFMSGSTGTCDALYATGNDAARFVV